MKRKRKLRRILTAVFQKHHYVAFGNILRLCTEPAAFLRRYVPTDKQRLIDATGRKIDFSYDSYDWSLNNWVR